MTHIASLPSPLLPPKLHINLLVVLKQGDTTGQAGAIEKRMTSTIGQRKAVCVKDLVPLPLLLFL